MIRTNSSGRGPRPRRRRGNRGPKIRNPALRDREIAQGIDLMIDRRDPAERPDSRFIRANSPGRGPRPRRRRGKRGPKRRNPALRDREVAQGIDLMIDRRDPAERPDSRFIRTNSPGRGPRPRRRRGKRGPKRRNPALRDREVALRHRSDDRQSRSGREAGQSLDPD